VEKGRVFKRVYSHIKPCPMYAEVHEENDARWIEEVYIQPQSIWHGIECDMLERGRAPISARLMPTIPAIVFLGVGRHESYGRVEHKHLFRPATDEELQQPEREPKGGISEAFERRGLLLTFRGEL
jgi:hypothetical protein